MAQKKRSAKKSQSLIVPFTKKLTIKSGFWAGHLTTTLAQGKEIQTNCGKGVEDFNSSTLYS